VEVIDSIDYYLPAPLLRFVIPDDSHFCVRNDSLVRVDDQQLIIYLGDSATFYVDGDISIVSDRCFAKNTRLQSVVFDSHSRLKALSAYAFYNCTHLHSITVPESVLVIGEGCFEGCNELTTVSFEFPARIRRIESEAFRYCSTLTSFTVPSSVSTLGQSVFKNCSRLSSATSEPPSNLTDIPDELFYDCGLLTSLCLPDSVIKIAGSAFVRTSLHSLTGRGFSTTDSLFMQFQKIVRCLGAPKSVVIPSTVREIGQSAFAEVSSLVDLSFEEGVERIKFSAFHSCSGLRAVAFPASLLVISESAFFWCGGLREVTFAADSKLQCIGKEAFSSCHLKEVLIPANLTEIDPSAFSAKVWACVKFEGPSPLSLKRDILCSRDSRTIVRCFLERGTVEVPAHIEVIGRDAFERRFLGPVIFASGSRLREIGKDAFSDSRLSAITVPSSVEILGDRCFEHCTDLVTVTFEEKSKLKKIGERAFACSSIRSYTIPASTNEIDGSAFAG
jgi:hypothetical protein